MSRRAIACSVLALTLVAPAAGCGQSDKGQVKDTVEAFRKATADRDYGTICKDILARDLVGRLDQLGVPCETALRKYLADTRKPKITVQRVQVRGTTATAFVSSSAAGQPASREQLRLVKEQGEWHIASLGGS